MRTLVKAIALAVLFTAVSSSAAFAQATPASSTEMMAATAASSLKWGDISVPGFDPGLKIAVINGNPDATGPYTLRLNFPKGYRFPPHWHPNAENLTVISGTFQLAMGDKRDDAKLKSYGPGDFLYIPGTHPHFGGVQDATIIQLHGQGPFTINLVKGASQ
jgi:quercetin dioxygenase-like cupin family protein